MGVLPHFPYISTIRTFKIIIFVLTMLKSGAKIMVVFPNSMLAFGFHLDVGA